MYHMILYYIIIIYKCGPCPFFDELFPGICLTTEGKTRKKPQLGYHNTQYLYKILQSISLSAKQHTLLFTVIKNHNGIHTSLYTVIKIHNKHKHSHTIKITARYVGCSVSRWNVESSIHSWSLAWLKWRYTIRTQIFKFCDKVTQYMLYTVTTRIFKF